MLESMKSDAKAAIILNGASVQRKQSLIDKQLPVNLIQLRNHQN